MTSDVVSLRWRRVGRDKIFVYSLCVAEVGANCRRDVSFEFLCRDTLSGFVVGTASRDVTCDKIVRDIISVALAALVRLRIAGRMIEYGYKCERQFALAAGEDAMLVEPPWTGEQQVANPVLSRAANTGGNIRPSAGLGGRERSLLATVWEFPRGNRVVAVVVVILPHVTASDARNWLFAS